MDHILSWVVFLPILVIPILWLLPKSKAKWVALFILIADFIVAIPIFTNFDLSLIHI